MKQIDFSTSPTGKANLWKNIEELRERQEDGRRHAQKLFPGDAKWENRMIQLAQGISQHNWFMLKQLPKDRLLCIVDAMITGGFPADVPYDSVTVA